MTNGPTADRNRTLRLLGALVGLSATLGACSHAPDAIITGGVPDDYRLRHPIAITEANSSIVVFVGHARAGLTMTQRSDVVGLAHNWVREGTGAVVAEVPVDTTNARAAAATFQEIRQVPIKAFHQGGFRGGASKINNSETEQCRNRYKSRKDRRLFLPFFTHGQTRNSRNEKSPNPSSFIYLA